MRRRKTKKVDGRSRNIIRAKPDFLSEEEFKKIVSAASSQFYKKAKIVVTEHGEMGTTVSCGPLITYISKSKKTIKMSIDGGKSCLDYFGLYVRKGDYQNEFVNFASKIASDILEKTEWYQTVFNDIKDRSMFKTPDTHKVTVLDKKNKDGQVAVEYEGFVTYVDESDINEEREDKGVWQDIMSEHRNQHHKMLAAISNANLSLTATKSKSLYDAMRKYMAVVWRNIDPEALAILNKVVGYGAGSVHYNLIMHNKRDAVTLFQSTPSVLPLFFYLYARKTKGNGAHYYVQRYNQIRVPLTMKGGIVPFMREEVPLLKKKSLWKWLCKVKPRWIAAYVSRISRRHRFGMCMLKIWSDVGVMPKYTTFIECANNLNNFEVFFNRREAEHLHDNPNHVHAQQDRMEKLVWFLRNMSEQSLKQPAKTFYNQYASLAYDWFRDRHENLTKRIMKQATWGWIVREQEDWHANRFNRLYSNSRKMSWESLIDEVKLGDYIFVALTSSQDLANESAKMGHCVASYDRYCDSGDSRIFSIERGRSKLATLEIKKIVDSDGHTVWRQAQLRGPENKDVDKDIKTKANSLVRAYQKRQNEIEEKKRAKIAA